jgi:L-lactate dehydrogenase (cytochrome)
MPVITHIEDLRVLATAASAAHVLRLRRLRLVDREHLPRERSDFQRIKLRQRVAVDMDNRTLRTKMVGVDTAMPVAIAPTGLTGMQHADGEILGALAAKKFGIPFTLSTMSICSIEDIAQATNAPFWFQALRD